MNAKGTAKNIIESLPSRVSMDDVIHAYMSHLNLIGAKVKYEPERAFPTKLQEKD